MPTHSCSSSFATLSLATGAGKSQDELMLKDECILVDEHDNLTGSANKHSCHRFVPEQPQGQLHRAFSVFLFDESNRLLIQQRAKDKITFPSVWTNTCCSHPLAGQVPDEVDAPEQVSMTGHTCVCVLVQLSSFDTLYGLFGITVQIEGVPLPC